jgi:hypothetical protein
MIRKLLPALLATSLLTGCSSNALRPASTPNLPQPAAEREGTAVLIQAGNCENRALRHEAGSAIAAAAIGIAVDFAISGVTALIRRQREGRNATWVASGDATGIRPDTAANVGPPRTFNPTQYCLTIARGVFLEGRDENGDFQFRDQPVFLLRIDLTLAALPGDAQITNTAIVLRPAAPAANAAAAPAPPPTPSLVLTAEPYELLYADTSTPVRGSGRKNVSVVVAFSPQTLQPASGAAATPDTSKATVLRFDFGRLTAGRSYNRRLLSTVRAAAAMPINRDRAAITAVVSESEDSNIALDAFISAFESNSDALSTALKATIEEAVGNSDDN